VAVVVRVPGGGGGDEPDVAAARPRHRHRGGHRHGVSVRAEVPVDALVVEDVGRRDVLADVDVAEVERLLLLLS
jgi:hypothetical protein